MASISPVKTPQGVPPAACPQAPLPRSLTGRRCRWTGVQDPGNVGHHPADAGRLDADGLLPPRPRRPPTAGRRCASSMGAVFRRPIYSGTPEELAALRTAAACLCTGRPAGGHRGRPAGGHTCRTLAIGAEGRGLSREVLNPCDQTIRIPMSDRLRISECGHCRSRRCGKAGDKEGSHMVALKYWVWLTTAGADQPQQASASEHFPRRRTYTTPSRRISLRWRGLSSSSGGAAVGQVHRPAEDAGLLRQGGISSC